MAFPALTMPIRKAGGVFAVTTNRVRQRFGNSNPSALVHFGTPCGAPPTPEKIEVGAETQNDSGVEPFQLWS